MAHRIFSHAALFLALLLSIFSEVTHAIIPRNVSVDVGFGVPHLIFGQGVVKISDHWQIGLGYGLLPGLNSIGQNIVFNTQTLTLSDGTPIELTPTMNAGLNTLLPFIRYFPRDNNFYIQATYALLQVKADVSGTLKTPPPFAATVGLLNGTATVNQPIPTVSVGYVFAGSAYFCDIALGFSFFLSPSLSIDLKTLIPDALGGAEGNQSTINQINNYLADQIDTQTAAYRSQYPIIPSLSFTFGIML